MFIAEAEASQYLTTTPEPLFFKYVGIINIFGVITAIYANSVNDLTSKIIKNLYEENGHFLVNIEYCSSEQECLKYNLKMTNALTNEKTEEILRVYKIHKHLTT